MYLCVHADRNVTFEDVHNFRAFKVAVQMPKTHLHDVRVALAKVAMLPDRETAWVSAAALRHWPHVEHDENWQKSFAAMIEKARPYGWIDDANDAIKAHVEWLV